MKKRLLVLSEGPADRITDTTGTAEKYLVLTLVRERQNFRLSLHCHGDSSYFYVNKTRICKFKVQDNIRWYEFCLGNVSKDFTKDEKSDISLNGIVYDFSVDHSPIEKEDILNIHEYLMVKNNVK